MFCVVAVTNNLQIIFAICVLAPFLVLSPEQAVAFDIFALSCYLPTYFGQPATTGHRRWDSFRFSFVMQDYIKWHKGRVFFTNDLRQDIKYVFAFAPHGVMPTTAMWLLYHPVWRMHMRSNDATLLGSSVFHYVPFLRDLAMWLGSREITPVTFSHTLQEGKSVIMVPGGLSEMKFSKSSDNHIKILTRHKGFIRMAMKEGTPLVPVYSFGETRYLDTINVPVITPFFFNTIKSPFPYFRGLLGFLQIPRPTSITVVVGKPIHIQKNAAPTDAEVDSLHRQFYLAVKKLHTDYKEKAGYSQETLELVGMEGSDAAMKSEAALPSIFSVSQDLSASSAEGE